MVKQMCQQDLLMNMSAPSSSPIGEPGNVSNFTPKTCTINPNKLLSEYSEDQEMQNRSQQNLQYGPYYDLQYHTPPPPSFDEQVLGKWHSTGHVADPLSGNPLPQTTRIYRGSLGKYSRKGTYLIYIYILKN